VYGLIAKSLTKPHKASQSLTKPIAQHAGAAATKSMSNDFYTTETGSGACYWLTTGAFLSDSDKLSGNSNFKMFYLNGNGTRESPRSKT
jgi:hypothetical protein